MDIAQSNTQSGNIVADKLVLRQCLITKNGASLRADGAAPILIDDDLKVTGKSTFCDDITVNGAITTEGSTPIKASDLPLTITTPGHYFLSDDIVYSPTEPLTNAITIESPNVCLDFHCHKLEQFVPADPSTQVPYTVGVWVLGGSTGVTIKGCKGKICNFSLAGIVGGDLFGRDSFDLSGLCISGMDVEHCYELASLARRPSPADTFGFPYRPDFPIEGGGILLVAMDGGTRGVTLRDVRCNNNFFRGMVVGRGSDVTLDNVNVDGTWSDDSGTTSGPESIVNAELVAGGSGYAVGDILVFDGGVDGEVEVIAVAAGVITDFELVGPGYDYFPGVATTTAATGSGSGATFTLEVGYESILPWGLTFAFVDNARLSNSTVNGTILRGDFTEYLNPPDVEGGGNSTGLTGLSILGCLNVAVDNCEFSGSESQFHVGTVQPPTGTVSVSGCKINFESINLTFTDCSFDNCRGMDSLWGFFCGGESEAITLRNCTSNFHYNRRDLAQPAPVLKSSLDAYAGFYIITCFQVLLENCTAMETGCVGPLTEFSRSAAFQFVVPFEGHTLRDCKALAPFSINGGFAIGYLFESFGTPAFSHTLENCIVTRAQSRPLDLAGHFYDSGKTYPENAVVHDGVDNYISLINGNTGNTPSTSPGAWVLGTTGKTIDGVPVKIVQGIANGFYTGNFFGPRGLGFTGSVFRNCQAIGCDTGAESLTMETELFPGDPITFYSAGFSVQPFDEPGGAGFDDKITFDGCTANDCVRGFLLTNTEDCSFLDCTADRCTKAGFVDLGSNATESDPKQSKSVWKNCTANSCGDGATHIGEDGNYNVKLLQPVATVSVGSSGGTGYTVADVLTLDADSGDATVTVTGEAAGVITSVTLTTSGTFYLVGTDLAVTGGTGTGALINVDTVTTIHPPILSAQPTTATFTASDPATYLAGVHNISNIL